MSLPYQGPPPSTPKDIVHRAYVEGLLAGNLPQATVDALIAAGFASYATKSYVDAGDTALANKAFIDAGDATRLKLAQKEINNGIVGLSPSGRVLVSRVNIASTQRFPKPFTSPAAYNASSVNASGTEVQLYPCAVADPGFTYKLLVTGTVDCSTSLDGQYPIVRVRQGSPTGQLVGYGMGLAETYVGGVTTQYVTPGNFAYPIPSWSAALDVICQGAGGGGVNGDFFAGDGKGGQKGGTSTLTLVRGTTIPLGTSSLSITVGAGGAAGDTNGVAGGATTAAGSGWGGSSGAGGLGGSGWTSGLASLGVGPGPISFNGQVYPGGATQDTFGGPGFAPGGGGAGGNGGLVTQPAGAGADGAAYVFAYPTTTTPKGPVTILPAYSTQTPITGATTLYVMLVRSGSSGTVTATNVRPALYVCPIPA